MREGSDGLSKSVPFQAPLLDSCWNSLKSSIVYAAGLERRVYSIDLESGESLIIGSDHHQAVKSLIYHSQSNTVISGSFDKTIQQIDVRAPASNSTFTRLPGKVFAMDATDKYLVVAMSERKVNIYDLRNLQSGPLYERDSALRYSPKTLRCNNNNLLYAYSSIDGRVAIDYYDLTRNATFAFKCHRIPDRSGAPDAVDTVTPVNALAFNSTDKTFFTGGSDHTVSQWDHQNRKKIREFPAFPDSVVALDVDSTGKMLAIGVSDDSFISDPMNVSQVSRPSEIYIEHIEPGEAL